MNKNTGYIAASKYFKYNKYYSTKYRMQPGKYFQNTIFILYLHILLYVSSK